MSDPLSVAASLVGLLTLAAQISTAINDIVVRTRDAPKDYEAVRQEVDDIHNVLAQLRVFVLGTSRPSRSRTSLIMVDQVVAILAGCVSTFSELDDFVNRLAGDQSMDLLDRLRWVSKQKQLGELLDKLQTHKASLTLMLTILTCQKQDDAEDKIDRLCELVESTLKQNEVLAQRLAAYEADYTSSMTQSGTIGLEQEDSSPPKYTPTALNGQGLAFEEQLITSRVYRKVTSYNDTLSVLSSGGHTGSWSMLSGLSLSELSNLAVVALPVYASDLPSTSIWDFSDTSNEKGILGSLSSSDRHVFGQPIANIYPYAHAAVSLRNDQGQAVIYGYLPKVVVYLGAFLKDHGKQTKDIFATNGHAGRVSALESIFDSASSRYGTALEGSPYTVHDAANLLLRYLKSLPEPIIPFDHYPNFMAAMQGIMDGYDNDVDSERVKFSSDIAKFQWMIQALPHFNRQLLVYILNLISLFALFADENQMTTARLIAVFQPALLAARTDMDATEHSAAAAAMVFLVENEGYFLSDSWVALSKNTKPTKA